MVLNVQEEPEGASSNGRESTEKLAAVRAYHQRTKHLQNRSAPGPGNLDWANQPDPFRRFIGARLIELPLVLGQETVQFGALTRPGTVAPRPLSLESLGLYFELSLGLTAWKELQGARWALRSNPSSGNLHPTEGYVLLPAINGVSKDPGVYHYAPREHSLEERCILSDKTWIGLVGAPEPPRFLVALSSVHWRESWKYGERAYRYCQHDAGHALGSLRYAAAALGWSMQLISELSDADLSTIMGLNRVQDFHDAEPEFPNLLGLVVARPNPSRTLCVSSEAVRIVGDGSWHGQANRLSSEHVHWPWIGAMEANAVKPHTELQFRPSTGRVPQGQVPIPPSKVVGRSAVSIIRQRRSAVAMDGQTSVSLDTFMGILRRTMPEPDTVPWDAFPFPARIWLCLFVHRVDDLPPGVYALMRDPTRLEALRTDCRDDFSWTPISGTALPVYELQLGDFRQFAAHVSCTQAIAGDGAFSLGMIADFARTLKEEGAWAYRRLFWEAGLVGHVLYLEAEAAGAQATGIGCYFDDLLHLGLGLDPEEDAWQSLYHFTVGGAVHDARLTTLPAYFHLPSRRAGHRRVDDSDHPER